MGWLETAGRTVLGGVSLGTSEALFDDPFGEESLAINEDIGEPGDWVGGGLNPGAEGQAQAADAARRGEHAWRGSQRPKRDLSKPRLDEEGEYIRDANGLIQYDYVYDEYGDPVMEQVGGVHVPTEDDLRRTGKDTAAGFYDPEGAFDLTPGEGDLLGEFSADRDLAGQGMTAQGTDYYEDVLSGEGFDAAAEADFERRRGQAQQTRRANTEAVMRDMELRGMGGSGLEALGALDAGQGQATSEYLGGLAANEQRQANMQGAAAGMVGAGQQRQSADDAWNAWYSEQDTDYSKYDADRTYGAKQDRYNRANYAEDHNVDVTRQDAVFNRNLPQRTFDNEAVVAGGIANAAGGTASILSKGAEDDENLMTFGGDVLKAYVASGA